MKNDFVPGNLAMRLKDIGFNEPCLKYKWCDKDSTQWMHNSNQGQTYHFQEHFKENKKTFTVSVPTFRQAFDWLLMNHGLEGWVQPNSQHSTDYIWGIAKPRDFQIPENCIWKNTTFASREEAEISCLDKIIEVVEQVKK